MAVFTTTDAKVMLPKNIADGIVTEARTGSTVGQLSAREPQRFGETEYIIFNDFRRRSSWRREPRRVPPRAASPP
ncbi:hypothetical protein [Arthrobacter woluwensis]|uniref:hypothetical protein n=1 Tax=Arthrobacter woluwensis TaxID=156980 RepID=UPI000A5FF25E|nr:hypothetical protein [Arthrobacter woluwensis]